MKIIGLMAGTSADGVDAALVEFDEAGVKARLGAHFEPYSPTERQAILGNMGAWEAAPETLDAIHNAHNRALQHVSQNQAVDYVAFHGQTLNHDPKNGRTLQAGDPNQLQTDAQVIYDFRSRDVQSGGEGAPLVPIYHYALAQELGLEEPVEFVNIGGVANVSFVNPKESAESGLMAFDVGVGNAMSDDLMAHFYGKTFDENGAMAMQGQADQAWLEAALQMPFFAQAAPKSLDRLSLYENFEALKALAPKDALATAMAFCVAGIEHARAHYPQTPARRILCGGGRRNRYLQEALRAENIDDFGIDGDMIEAEGFAYLAWAYLQNRPASFPQTTRVPVPTLAGQLAKSA